MRYGVGLRGLRPHAGLAQKEPSRCVFSVRVEINGLVEHGAKTRENTLNR